jgi:hypothetical protein
MHLYKKINNLLVLLPPSPDSRNWGRRIEEDNFLLPGFSAEEKGIRIEKEASASANPVINQGFKWVKQEVCNERVIWRDVFLSIA